LDNTTWQNTTTGAYAIYNNDPANDVIYGKLYNWFTTQDTRGLCPTGWHVPTDCEWMFLEGAIGMPISQQVSINGRGINNEGGALKSITLWNSPNVGATDQYSFSAIPGGYRNVIGPFSSIGQNGHWWTKSNYGSSGGWQRYLLNSSYAIVRSSSMSSRSGLSVRCLKD
jgi:uncharacterized protein (TIGR02145 family)